jgi:D-alanine-D-alanine ligase
MKKGNFKVLVLMGGSSAERDVSLASGEAIVGALKEAGYKVMALDTAGGNKLLADNGKYLAGGVKTKPPDTKDLQKSESKLTLKAIETFDFSDVDVIFLALHGGSGENGTIQALLDMTGKPYTGSGMLASALCMDKAMSKKIFERDGIPTPRWFLLKEEKLANIATIETLIESNLGFPVVVKPNDQGSTIGFSIVNSPSKLKEAIQKAEHYSNEVLFEEYISGKELTVGVLADQALPVIEIVPEHGVYDYECKYTKGKSKYICPAELPKHKTEEIQAYGLKAFKSLKCEGYARVDFRYSENERFYCLEVNSLPGMTATSLVPKAAKAMGIEFPELIDRIVQSALNKKRR